MKKLQTLIDKCVGSVTVCINDHKDCYQTVDEYFNSTQNSQEELEDINTDIYEKMKEQDTIINIHFYPTSPVGYYSVYHYDLEYALDLALETF